MYELPIHSHTHILLYSHNLLIYNHILLHALKNMFMFTFTHSTHSSYSRHILSGRQVNQEEFQEIKPDKNILVKVVCLLLIKSNFETFFKA